MLIASSYGNYQIMNKRIYFLDHLRTFMILLVVLTHAGMTYEAGFDNFWIVSDPAKLNGIALVRLYLDLFVMFTIFFISGYFAPASLSHKTSWQFILSKFHRIFIPWIVAVFLLIPAYKIIYLYSRGLPQEPWFTYFHIFRLKGGDPYYFPHNPTQSWLWFLPILFLFQILYLAIFKIGLIKIKISFPVALGFTFLTGLVSSVIIAQAGLTGWTHSAIADFQHERLLSYFLVFLLGSLCHAKNVFAGEKGNFTLFIGSNIALGIALAAYTIFALNLFNNLVNPTQTHFFISELGDRIVYYGTSLISMLSFLYLFIYSFQRSLDKPFKVLDRINPNSYYVYLIHMIVLGAIAMLLVRVHLPVVIKYLSLTVLTFVISHGLVLVIRENVPRILPSRMDWLILVAALILSGYIGTKNNDPTIELSSPISPSGTNLHEAAIRNDLAAVEQSIANGVDLDVPDPASGSNPLMTAIVFGRTEIALALMEGGADVNFQDKGGSTPLHAAAYFCRPELVKALLDHGANRSIRSRDGLTPLEVVSGPFEDARAGYDYFQETLGPLGLKLDYDYLQRTRPEIAQLLMQY